MDAYEQARRYVAAIPGAISGSGGHNQTFTVACALVHGFALGEGDAWAILQEYNRTCSPVWSESELRHKLKTAMESNAHQKPRGHLLSTKRSVKYQFGASGDAGNESRETPAQSASRGNSASLKSAPDAPSKSKIYDLDGKIEHPKPIADGTRELLKAAFQPGEGIRICQARNGDDGREVPRDGGVVLSLEEWLKKLDASNGDPNKFLRTSEKNGIFVTLNPMRIGGSKDADVTAYRHALIEFDSMSAAEQWNLIQQSQIPCTAVISSGGKSLHAWVRVDARDRREYDERVQLLYSHFAEHQRPDPKNKNPSRFSRLANCMRGERRQELLAIGVGAESFSAWIGDLETEGIGEELSIDALMSFVPENDPNCVIGKRYLCRGGSFMLVGQSGIGKSSMAVQMAIHMAIGRSLYGIAPVRPLKSVFVQAENDDGDLAEMLQGVVSALALTDVELELLRKNLVFISDASHVGEAFVGMSARLIEKHRPDLYWGDPVLSFIGDDASKQSVCAKFFRQGFGPIQKATGVVTAWVHHTGKPPADPKAGKRKTITDHSYAGTGSSDMTNAMRAVMVLQRVDDEHFELKLPKRGKRAGAKDLAGAPTLSVWLKQAEAGIHWEQIEEPVKESRYSSNKSKEGKMEFDVDGFMAGVGASSIKYGQMIERIREFGGVGERKAKEIWATVKDNFIKDEDGFYRAEYGSPCTSARSECVH